MASRASVDYHAAAQAARETLVARRRDFHAHPEIAFTETRTAAIVADTLRSLGLEVQAGVGRTGVVAVLEGAAPGPTVLVRADMDALPIQEDTALPYASQTPGRMHACGHDAHTAIALSVAELFAPLREHIAGRVKFVFQPAEEVAQGARAMVADGVLEDPRPDVSVGLHVWNSMPVGTLGVADGPIMAGASRFRIVITGKGAHAASPHLGIDPVVCAAHLITALQTIVSRNLDPFDTGVITVAQMIAGEAHNVIPQTAELIGTVRTFRLEVRDRIVSRMETLVVSVAEALGCTGQFEIEHSTDPVVNDPAVSARLRERFAALPGVELLKTDVRTMGAEDMSLFMHDIPGMYVFVGAADPTADAYYGHHHPRFTISEDALPIGMQVLASAVGSYVLGE
jgi:amidohydrolase